MARRESPRAARSRDRRQKCVKNHSFTTTAKSTCPPTTHAQKGVWNATPSLASRDSGRAALTSRNVAPVAAASANANQRADSDGRFFLFCKVFLRFGSYFLVNFSSFRAISGANFSYLLFLIVCFGCTPHSADKKCPTRAETLDFWT